MIDIISVYVRDRGALDWGCVEATLGTIVVQQASGNFCQRTVLQNEIERRKLDTPIPRRSSDTTCCDRNINWTYSINEVA